MSLLLFPFNILGWVNLLYYDMTELKVALCTAEDKIYLQS